MTPAYFFLNTDVVCILAQTYGAGPVASESVFVIIVRAPILPGCWAHLQQPDLVQATGVIGVCHDAVADLLCWQAALACRTQQPNNAQSGGA